MSFELPVLENLRVASPCSARWDEMQGDAHARFCGECRKNVYDLSSLTRDEAEDLIRIHEGHLCVRFYKRRDGTVLTQDCPVGKGRLRRALLFQVGVIAAIFMAIPGVAAAVQGSRIREWSMWDREPYHALALKLHIREDPPPMLIMGDIAPAPPPPHPSH
jgi:hypothetical protein